MDKLLEFINTDNFLLILSIIIIILILFCIVLFIKYNKLNKRYDNFIKKMSRGNNFEETLNVYMKRVNDVSERNEEIIKYCQRLDNNISKCIKKVGIVRYNAFKDVGSDLSFAVALLDREDDGIVFNGIYGSESSNIYAKPIKNGESSYQLSDEEKYAIEIAEQNKNFVAKRKQK